MKKRRILALLIAVTLLFSGGCRALSTLEEILESLRTVSFESDKYLADFADNWCYRHLSEDMQADYGDLYTAMIDGWETDRTVTVEGDTVITGPGASVRLSHPLSTQQEVKTLFQAFLYDNPQFFYLDRHYGMHGLHTDTGSSYEQITLLYTLTAEERRQAMTAITDAAADILQQAALVTDEFERELLLHDWLAAHCTYNTDSTADSIHDYTLYGALVDGRAVCEGYARAMQWLLEQCGSESGLVTGTDLKGESHMWNLVTVNGEPYHLDVTWNDSNDLPRHNYFNMTTEEAQTTRVFADTDIGIVDCTATADNFYRRTDRYLDTYSRREIAAAIAKEVMAGRESVELRFADGKFDNAVLFITGGNFFFETVEGYLSGQEMWDFDLYTDPEEGILMLQKSKEQ